MLCEKYHTITEPEVGAFRMGWSCEFWSTKACWTKYSYWSTADQV